MVLAGQDEPANDTLRFGIAGTGHWQGDGEFGAALDVMDIDFERLQFGHGISQPAGLQAIDGSGSFTRLSSWMPGENASTDGCHCPALRPGPKP